MIPAFIAPLLPMILKEVVPLVIGGAVDLAEGLFPKRNAAESRGAEKKAFVMKALEELWTELEEGGVIKPALSRYKGAILRVISLVIDQVVAKKKEEQKAA